MNQLIHGLLHPLNLFCPVSPLLARDTASYLTSLEILLSSIKLSLYHILSYEFPRSLSVFQGGCFYPMPQANILVPAPTITYLYGISSHTTGLCLLNHLINPPLMKLPPKLSFQMTHLVKSLCAKTCAKTIIDFPLPTMEIIKF